MIGPYMEAHEMQQLEDLLKHSLKDTLGCWTATRLKGSSASMACEGNVCVSLLKAFDEVAKRSGVKNGVE
jgi:hypothetical protein